MIKKLKYIPLNKNKKQKGLEEMIKYIDSSYYQTPGIYMRIYMYIYA
jgi:hypothetical protein